MSKPIELGQPLVDIISCYLPDDMADAFEQLKLVIMRHKAEQWAEVSETRTVNALWLLMQLAVQATPATGGEK